MYENKVIGVIGISGEPIIVKPIARIACSFIVSQIKQYMKNELINKTIVDVSKNSYSFWQSMEGIAKEIEIIKKNMINIH